LELREKQAMDKSKKGVVGKIGRRIPTTPSPKDTSPTRK
jgi:hypothetical protein